MTLCGGLVNSLRNEILGLVSISACIYSIGLQFEYLEKLKSDNGDEVASQSTNPQRRRKGLNTGDKEGLIKAIGIMQSKLDGLTN